MGQVFDRLWGPQSHSELTDDIQFEGWLNVFQREITFEEVDPLRQQINKQASQHSENMLNEDGSGLIQPFPGGSQKQTEETMALLEQMNSFQRQSTHQHPAQSQSLRNTTHMSLNNKATERMSFNQMQLIHQLGGGGSAMSNNNHKLDNLIDISPDLVYEASSQNMGTSALENSTSHATKVKVERWTHILQYVELSGDKLRFYQEKPDRQHREMINVTHQFLIYRKNGLVDFDESSQQFILMLQDYTAKFKQKKLKFECSQRHEFLTWIECLKKTQRPQWADPEVNSCYICEQEFSRILNRQHHCRKCGTAVCQSCSNYFIKLPEFAYYKRVRTCRNCMQLIQQREQLIEQRRKLEQRKRLMFDSQNQQNQKLIFYSQNRESRPLDINQIDPNTSLAQQEANEIRYMRDNMGYNSFNHNNSNNPDESNSYLHLSQFPA